MAEKRGFKKLLSNLSVETLRLIPKLFDRVVLGHLHGILLWVVRILLGFFASEPFVSKLIGVKVLNIIINVIAVLVLVLILFLTDRRQKAMEKKSMGERASDYKCVLKASSGMNRSRIIDIYEGLKDEDPRPLFDYLKRFRCRFIPDLDAENIHERKSEFAYLQISFIVKNKQGEIAVYHRFGEELSSLPKLLSGCSVLKSFSPASLRKPYLIESILHKVGLRDKNSLREIKPLGIGYNETTKENLAPIRYFFVIYQIVVDPAPQPMHRSGDSKIVNKPGEQLLGFFKPDLQSFSGFEFKGKLDKKIIDHIIDAGTPVEEDKTDISPGDCIFFPSDTDVLKIAKKLQKDGQLNA